MARTLLILTCFDSLIWRVNCISKTDIERHLTLGLQLQTKGKYSEALSHFHAAIDAEPSNYMSYYKRANLFMDLSRSRPALTDLDRAIKLKPDFIQARVKRGSILTKMGLLDEAQIELKRVLTKDPKNKEANKLFSQIKPLQKNLQEIQYFMSNKYYQSALDRMQEIIELIPWDPWLRETRVEAYLGIGNIFHAKSEMRALTKLTSDNTDSLFKLANLHYQLGEADSSFVVITECLKLDPEHKECYPLYKKLQKVTKFLTESQKAQNTNDWAECVSAAQEVLKNEPTVHKIRFHAFDRLCRCTLKGGMDAIEAIKSCGKAIRIKAEPRLLCDRAESYLGEDLFDEAVKDYSRALKLDENFKRAKQGLATARKFAKQGSKRDHYQILGLHRNAGMKEITKAYRKLAQKWHPDNFQDDKEKKIGEKKFIEIVAAREWLQKYTQH